MWYQVITNYREFLIEANGIGSAIESAMLVCVCDRGEYIRSVELTITIEPMIMIEEAA